MHRHLPEHFIAPLFVGRVVLVFGFHFRLHVVNALDDVVGADVSKVTVRIGGRKVIRRAVLHDHGARLVTGDDSLKEKRLDPEQATHLRNAHRAADDQVALLGVEVEKLLAQYLANAPRPAIGHVEVVAVEAGCVLVRREQRGVSQQFAALGAGRRHADPFDRRIHDHLT